MKKAITDIIPLEKFTDADNYSFIKLLGNGITRIIAPKYVTNVEMMDEDCHIVKVEQTDSETMFNIDDIDTVYLGKKIDIKSASLTDSQRCVVDMLTSKLNERLKIYLDEVKRPIIINPRDSDVAFIDAGGGTFAVKIKTKKHGYFFNLDVIHRLVEDYEDEIE